MNRNSIKLLGLPILLSILVSCGGGENTESGLEIVLTPTSTPTPTPTPTQDCQSSIDDFPSYQVIDLGTLGGESSKANAINDSGQVVGSSFNGNSINRAFIYEMGVMSDLGDKEGYLTEQSNRAFSINNIGLVVGDDGLDSTKSWGNGWIYDSGIMSSLAESYTEEDSAAYDINDDGIIVGSNKFPWVTRKRAFVVYPGDSSITDLGELNPESKCGSSAFAINNNNQIVGYAGDFGILRCDKRAFLFENFVMHDLGTLGGADSFAYDINENSCIVGSSQIINYGPQVAFLYSNNEMVSIGTLGGASRATAINNENVIVGSSEISSGETHAFIYFNQEMYDLNSLVVNGDEWDYLYIAEDINDNGMIVGAGVMKGVDRAFLLMPEVNVD